MDLAKFRLRSFTILQPTYSMDCGSSFELNLKYCQCSVSDYDHIYYFCAMCAIPWNRNPPKNTRCTILRIDSTKTPPGYAKLKVDGDNLEDRPSYYRRPRFLADVESGGPSREIVNNIDSALFECYKYFDKNYYGVDFKSKSDQVFSIYCPYWPPEAEEWVKRNRFHGWPNEKLIARVARGGCHFVSKLRTWSSRDDTEWRFSFSKAEILLIHSWTNVQKLVYHTIRVIKKNMSEYLGGDGNRGLQTYYFKTLMFWACEELPPEFWSEHNLKNCLKTLLLRFIRCLENKYCPSYFIPECNIMIHLKAEERFEKELNTLRKYFADGKIPMREIEGEILFSMPVELQCLRMLSQIHPINENITGRFGQYLSECEWFLPRMKNLHAAIEANLRLMSLDNVTSRRESKYYVECLENFECAFIRNEDFESYKYSNPELTIYETLNAILLRRQVRNSIPVYRRNIRRSFEFDTFEQMFNESIPSTLFCAASAYRATFYFVAMKSYKESLTECHRCWDVLDNSKYEFINGHPQEYDSNLPVLVCNSLSQIYDEHLQVIIGFSTLHRNISYESPNYSSFHEVCIKCDAKEFLKYLHIQCEHRLSAKRERIVGYNILDFDRFQPHMSQLVDNRFYSAAILYAALRQSKAYTEPLRGHLIPRHYSHML